MKSGWMTVLLVLAEIMGALQTASGVIDIDLGDARLLEANHLAIASGDSLRLIGEEVIQGRQKQFVSRNVQKGTQAVLVRNASGFPLLPAAPMNADKWKTQGGVQ